MTTPDLSLELEQLRTRLAEVEREQREQRRRRWRLGGFAALAAVIAGTAYAANGNCPNGMPVCFAPNTPAKAVDVNLDFAQLKEWAESKIGTLGTPGVNIPSGGLTVAGGETISSGDLHVSNGRIHGQDPSGDTHVYTQGGGYLYLNFYSGSAVAVGDGAQHLVSLTDANGLHMMNNTNIFAQGHRTPSVAIANNCNAGSCSQTCPTGTVIKMAFGLHGQGWNASSGSWACPGGFQWLGGCIGQTSCQVSTGCSTSGIWLECW
jgi:hypothetical protein